MVNVFLRLFRELDPDSVPAPRVAAGLRSPLGHTIARVAEQAWSRRAS